MNTGGDAAERLVRDSLMITEEAVKLAGLGAKKPCGDPGGSGQRGGKDPWPHASDASAAQRRGIEAAAHQKRGPAAVPTACKGIRRPVLPDQKQISGQRAERYPVSGQRGGKRQPRAGAYGLPCAAGKGGGGKKEAARGRSGSASQTRGHGSDSNARTTATERPSVRAAIDRLQKQARTQTDNAVRTVTRDEPYF